MNTSNSEASAQANAREARVKADRPAGVNGAARGRLPTLLATLVALLAGGCAAVRQNVMPPTLYSLDQGTPASSAATAADGGPTVVVSVPHAAAGFDTERIVYLQRPQEPRHFGRAQWVETPPRMLAPLLVDALKATGAFRAVVHTPTSAIGDLRLDSEIVRLQHEFFARPSRVRFTLRATLVDVASRRILGWREFDAVAPAPSEDPYGGVLAAGRAVETVLREVATFSREAADGR